MANPSRRVGLVIGCADSVPAHFALDRPIGSSTRTATLSDLLACRPPTRRHKDKSSGIAMQSPSFARYGADACDDLLLNNHATA